jgi:TRAP-type C4-dicarboxylate transport system permease small subunit
MDIKKETVLRKTLNRLYSWSCWLAAACIAAICLLVVCQVGLNIVDRISSKLTGSAIGLTIPSYADFTGFFLAAASFLALAHTLRRGGHIRVSLFISHFGTRVQKGIEVWCLSLALGVSLYFTWYTFLLTRESALYNDLSPGMVAVPIWIPQTAMLAGLLVLSIALVDELICCCRGHAPSYTGAGENMLVTDEETKRTS